MSLYKRKGSAIWWVKFSFGGQRIRRTAGTEIKKQAEEFEAKLKASLWEQGRLGVKPRRTWKEAVVRWVGETAHKKSHSSDLGILRWLDRHLSDLCLQDINRELINYLVAEKRTATGRSKDGKITPATINRMLSVVRAILRKAQREWEWIDRAPVVKLMSEPKMRVRWLTPGEAAALLGELPKHLAAIAEFSLETGLRSANARGLRWDQIDMQRSCAWIHADDAKGGKAIPVPLSRRAKEIIRAQVGKHVVFVFTYAGKPLISQLSSRTFHSACARAGIKDFRWHDLRHTWASWHIQAGTPMEVLQEMGAWADVQMVRRYAHLSANRLLQFVERNGTKVGTVEKLALSDVV